MFQKIGNLFSSKPAQRTSPVYREPVISSPLMRRTAESEKKHSYTKIFRWRLPEGHTEEPRSVEVVGSFSRWQRVHLERDSKQGAWHATVHHIPGNKTHHYMLLLDGHPAFDKTCDGLVVPHGFEEEQFQLATERGPRVLMLFAQTK
jgi:hypothetical protein